MKKIVFTICIFSSVFLFSCKEESLSINESNYNDLYATIEELEDDLNYLLEKGHANKDELIKLKDEIERLHSYLDDDFYETDFYEP